MQRQFLLSAIIFLLLSTQSYSALQDDQLKYTILKWDKSYYWIFSNVTAASISPTEIKLLEDLMSKAITAHNLSKVDDAYKIGPLSNYHFQFIPVFTKKGQKEVWVNALCSNPGINWRKEIIIVNDGGNCYFNLKVNLTTRGYYQLYVNGYA